MAVSAEMVTALSGVGVSVVTAGGTWMAARASRRTREQERRDDFVALTEQAGKAIERLERRVQAQEEEADKQRRRIADQDAAIGWLAVRIRALVAYIRKAGLEPPAPDPMPERARDYLNHIDV
jgi:hypothetical protein